MIRVYLVIALYILVPILIIECFKRWTWMQKIGTVVAAYAVGIIFALTGFVHFEPETAAALTFGKLQSTIMSIAVPLAIPLMLFNCDFKLWTKALPKTIWSLVGGIMAVIVAVISGYFIFRRPDIPEFNKIAAMMTGIYTGGTMNFNALGASLGVDKTVMAIVLAFEMVLTTPYIFFIIGGGYKVFRKILPYQDVTRKGRVDDNVESKDVENYRGMFDRKNVGGMFAGLGLSVLFLLVPEAALYSVYMAIVVTVVMIVNVWAYTHNSVYEKMCFAMLDKAKIEIGLKSAGNPSSKREESDDEESSVNDSEGADNG